MLDDVCVGLVLLGGRRGTQGHARRTLVMNFHLLLFPFALFVGEAGSIADSTCPILQQVRVTFTLVPFSQCTKSHSCVYVCLYLVAGVDPPLVEPRSRY